MKKEKALRFNEGKLKWSLIDFPSLEPMIKVLEFGCEKYEPHNWKRGLPTTEICESLIRHLTAYLEGEDIDQDSKLSHIGHMQCNLMFLSYMDKYMPEYDTRYKDKNKNK